MYLLNPYLCAVIVETSTLAGSTNDKRAASALSVSPACDVEQATQTMGNNRGIRYFIIKLGVNPGQKTFLKYNQVTVISMPSFLI